MIQKSLVSLTHQLLAEARDAGLKNDVKRKETLDRQIDDGFEDKRLLANFKKQFTANELQARKQMREATSLIRRSNDVRAKSVLMTIVSRYPETLTAKRARTQLASLQRAKTEPERKNSENVMLYLAPGLDGAGNP